MESREQTSLTFEYKYKCELFCSDIDVLNPWKCMEYVYGLWRSSIHIL